MKQKRSKLDIEISRLQKNARNKLYRLRKKGAINANMAAKFNPVRPAKELKGLSDIEKRQYAEALKDFNKRDLTKYQFKRGTEVIIQNGGTPIIATELWEKRLQEAELNIIREENNARLRQIRDSVLANIPASQVRNIDYIEFGNDVFTPMKKVVRTTDFKPGAKTNYAAIKARLSTALEDSHVATYKKAVINKLKDNDVDSKLIARIEKITDNELLYLHFFTDFSMQIAEFEYSDVYELGYYEPSPQERTSVEAAIHELLQFLGK